MDVKSELNNTTVTHDTSEIEGDKPKPSKETIKLNSKRVHEGVANADDTTKRTKYDDEKYDEVNDADLLSDLNIDALTSRIVVHTLEAYEGCTHEVTVPPNYQYDALKINTGEPAKQYSFILDPFQKEAILCIDNLQSVLVSAHTSAGKTVVAEYAIALSLKHKQRVIYTTPIKALSNQKYREFSEEFVDVGLITGDVTINPTASCLIMTTEILRNMLYKGSEIMREVGWVVFDEIHYMRDKERGVVWEETLILLPDNVRYVFLSATIPNARQFAEWVCHLHSQPCHVVYTEYRPTPLQHYIYPAGGDGMHLVIDEKGIFKEDNFSAAMSVLSNTSESSKGKQRGRPGGYKNNTSNIYNVVKMINERNLSPVIIFSFSKKDCESYAMQMTRTAFNTIEEKKLVDEVFNNAMDVLSEEDRKLPQVEHFLPLLRRGIGIHHGGLLPILKETIEILFGSGLIKVLFATETFAMGLNMPARTVVFTNCRKFDGKDFRFINSGEYIQMSGRAGRRGLDVNGLVILMVDQKVSPTTVKDMVQGKADHLNSAFHLTYNMVLNLLRVEDVNPEFMMERSFFQFQNQVAIPELVEKLMAKKKEYDAVILEQEHSIADYFNLKSQLETVERQYRSFITKPEYVGRYFQLGRLVKVKIENVESDWGVILSFKRKRNKDKESHNANADVVYVLNIALLVKESTNEPCPTGEVGDLKVVPVSHTCIYKVGSLRMQCPKDLRPRNNHNSVLQILEEAKKRFPEGLPLIDPIKDMHITDPVFKKCANEMKELEDRLQAHPIQNDPQRNTLIATYDSRRKLYEELMQIKAQVIKAKSILQMDELKKRKRVLRRLGYCNDADVIELKGRIACELSSADELLLTELILNGVFTNLAAEKCVALLSCFVCEENPGQTSTTGEELRGVLQKLQEFARRIAKVSIESKMDLDEDQYVSKFKSTLVDVMLAWAKGASFMQICKMTDVFEGSIIRSMRRLEELLRQLCQAAKNIGNSDLEIKFSEAIKLMKRDIVFAASLYM